MRKGITESKAGQTYLIDSGAKNQSAIIQDYAFLEGGDGEKEVEEWLNLE